MLTTPAIHVQHAPCKPPIGPIGGGARHPLGEFDRLGINMVVRQNQEIHGQGEPAEFIYRVISGAVRTSRFLADGRRQIGGFHLAGDLFGMELGAGDAHALSAEAICNARILAVRRSAAISLAAADCRFATELWNHAARDLGRAAGHMMLLGRKSAGEKVAAFLTEMSKRGGGATTVDLPMPRQDIADYLGLTIETVSRTLTSLEEEGLIGLPTARRIELADPGGLERLAS